MDSAERVRDRAIIATLTESGLRLSELANISASDIDWQAKTIKKEDHRKGPQRGVRPVWQPLRGISAGMALRISTQGSIWDLNYRGIVQILRRLERQIGLKFNPHVFRRSFAVLLRKVSVDCLTIRDLGRWESVSMVERYTRSFNFDDAMKSYKGTLGA